MKSLPHLLLSMKLKLETAFNVYICCMQLGSVLSIYGCYQYHNKVGGDSSEDEGIDPENGANATSRCIESSGDVKQMGTNQERNDPDRKIAGFWGYVLQIIFQVLIRIILI